MARTRHRPGARDDGAVVELDIDAIGAQGDGLAAHADARVFVPYTAPGDRVRARLEAKGHARVLEWLKTGPDRQTPPCPHFGPGKCGGCALQHIDDTSYAAWKLERATEALARAGFPNVRLQPLARTTPGARRRAEFAATGGKRGVAVGFHARASHDIVAIGPCPVLVTPLAALLPRLREFLGRAFTSPATLDILATYADGGIELVFTGAASLERARREHLAAFADAADLARIAWRGNKRETPEIVVQRRSWRAMFGEIAVDLPPGAFLQASLAGERAIQAAVATAARGARHLADLYAGCGSIALSLADKQRRLYAVDSDRASVQALEAAARRAGLGAQLRAETRDLVRRPLTPDELTPFDAVIFDPPREGAAAQAAALAASKVPIVAAVSCDPATFARDARLLAAGGYRLVSLTPIDQFLWSPHLELVGEFRR
jgi:23S rRNA (uracil1939-C5)-methyltransferase